MIATKTRESHHVDLDITDGPSMTDTFGDTHTIIAVRISYLNRQVTAIRIKGIDHDVFVENTEDASTWPEWLSSLVDQYRNP